MPRSSSLKILRTIQKAIPPICCGQKMTTLYLNFGDMDEKALQDKTEQEYADYICSQPIPPVFSCTTCHAEKPIPNLTWPEPKETTTPPPKSETPGLNLTPNEAAALKELLHHTAKAEGEDLLGLFIKYGLASQFKGNSKGLITLAQKFEPHP